MAFTINYSSESLTADLSIIDATPALDLKDYDCTDSDINATININATDTGSGSEDIDVFMQAQVAGSLTTFLDFNADGALTLGYAGQPITFNGATTTAAVFFADDIPLKFGNIAATPDATIEWDTASAPNCLLTTSPFNVLAGDFKQIQGATDYHLIDASTTPHTFAAGCLDIDLRTSTTNNRGIDIDVVTEATTGIQTYGQLTTVTDHSVVTATDQYIFGHSIGITKDGADTSADDCYVTGQHIQITNSGATDAGTKTTKGVDCYVTGDTAGTSSAYGLYSYVQSADTNYGVYISSQSGTTNYGLKVEAASQVTQTSYGVHVLAAGGGTNYAFYAEGGNSYLNGALEVTGSITSGDHSITSTGTATVGSPTKNSNSLFLEASAWDTDDGVARSPIWELQDVPTSGDTPYGTLHFYYADGIVSRTSLMSINRFGNLSVSAQATAGKFVANTGGFESGSATADGGDIEIIKGAQTGDPQVTMSLSTDALGDFSITTDTGDIYAIPAGLDFYVGNGSTTHRMNVVGSTSATLAWREGAGLATQFQIVADFANDQAYCLVDSNVGRQFILADNDTGSSKDFDHATETNPTLFIHSAVDPDISNNQWGSLTHDQEGLVISTGVNVGTGTGATTDDNYILFKPRGAEQMRLSGEGLLTISSQAVDVEAVTASVTTSRDSYYFGCDTVGADTVTLQTLDCVAGRIIVIKDEGGNAAVQNITIDTEGSETIDGQASTVITEGYGYIKLISNGSHWFVIP
jgi:hypothetical protein